MEPVMLAALITLFTAVVVAFLVIAQLLPAWAGAAGRIAAPVAQEAVATRSELKEQASSTLARLGARFRSRYGRFLPASLREERWQDSHLQRKFAQAGYRSYAATSLLLGAMVCSAVVGVVAAVMIAISVGYSAMPLAIVVAALLGLVIGVLLPAAGLEILIRRRQRQLLEHFPDALDLIRICLEAGLGLDASIQRVGKEFSETSPALFDEFHMLSLELRAGAGRTQALQNLAQRCGLAEIRSWVSMILQSEKFGTGIAEAVKIHSDQLRLSRRLNAEQRAATLSTKLLFPLVICVFPALLLVLLGPAAITIQQQLGQTMERSQ